MINAPLSFSILKDVNQTEYFGVCELKRLLRMVSDVSCKELVSRTGLHIIHPQEHTDITLHNSYGIMTAVKKAPALEIPAPRVHIMD